MLTNHQGNLMWASDMVWKGQPAFTSQSLQPWHSGGKAVGTFKEVFIQVGDNDHKTRFTFLTVDGAGHMVRSPRLVKAKNEHLLTHGRSPKTSPARPST